jgi:hypothetical protein
MGPVWISGLRATGFVGVIVTSTAGAVAFLTVLARIRQQLNVGNIAPHAERRGLALQPLSAEHVSSGQSRITCAFRSASTCIEFGAYISKHRETVVLSFMQTCSSWLCRRTSSAASPIERIGSILLRLH